MAGARYEMVVVCRQVVCIVFAFLILASIGWPEEHASYK
jgi:hypothetical protein